MTCHSSYRTVEQLTIVGASPNHPPPPHQVLTIVSMLAGEQVLMVPTGKLRTVARKCHQRLASVEGDHLTLLNVYRKFNAAKKNKVRLC